MTVLTTHLPLRCLRDAKIVPAAEKLYQRCASFFGTVHH